MTNPVRPGNRKGCIIAAALVLSLGTLAIAACIVFGSSVLGSSSKETTQLDSDISERLKHLESARVSDLKPNGDLLDQFRHLSDFSDLQRGSTEREIKGKVVEWTLTVFEVSHHGEEYRIQTSDRNKVDTVVIVHPLSGEDKSRIESLRTGTPITVRGYINGILTGSVEIDPAIVLR